MTSSSPVVLLVEGDITVRHPLAEYLRECGFTVFEASNGDEAKHALTTTTLQIEIVLADMATEGSGFALRRWIRERGHPAVVICWVDRKSRRSRRKHLQRRPGARQTLRSPSRAGPHPPSPRAP